MDLPLHFLPPERFDIHTMNSSVIGTIELADQPIESLAPSCAVTLPERIRKAYAVGAPDAELAIVTEEVIDANLTLIRNQLSGELCQIMQAIDAVRGRA